MENASINSQQEVNLHQYKSQSVQGHHKAKHDHVKTEGDEVKSDRLDFKFDKKEFDAELHKMLLKDLFDQQKSIDSDADDSLKFIDPLLYNVSDDAEAAEVPEYWNAENTSQRIVDFATSFLSAFDGAPEEFQNDIKEAIKKGFEEAKDIMGELPEASAKLYNDTYELTMEKLDNFFDYLGESSEGNTEETQPLPQLDLVA